MHPLPHYTTRNANDTIRLGVNLGKTLVPGDVIFLFGELGAGKTHLIKGIAKGLGIRSMVKSPTYAFHKSYSIRRGLFHHYDLYRLYSLHDIETIGFFETLSDASSIHAVEWSERLGSPLPPRRIELHLEAHDAFHTIRVHRVSPEIVPAASVDFFYEEFATPSGIQKHCQLVARISMQIAEAMMRRLDVVDTDLLYSAALLHDVVRPWEKPGGKNHAELAADIFNERGYHQTAATILPHSAHTLVKHPDWLDTLEKKILYYADKRAMHDRVVTVRERLADGRKRWFKKITPELERSFKVIEKAALRLEKELFEGLDLRPEEIL